MTAYAPICVACYLPVGASAAMTLSHMKALKGTAQLEITVDKLFGRCGLPAAVVDHGRVTGEKQSVDWHGTAMHLSAMDWDAVYGMRQPKVGKPEAWINVGKLDSRCINGLSQLVLKAKGNVGVLRVTKKAQGFGYDTSYWVPKNLYKAHKVLGIRATLTQSLAVATLVGRYGQPDEILKQSAPGEKFRYWVLTRRDHRPELLYAVDFEIDSGGSRTYAISSSGVDFVQQRLEKLLQQWERDYVLD